MIELHQQEWLNHLRTIYTNQNIDTFMQNQTTIKFMNCIENSGVFKQTKSGIKQFDRFIKELTNVLNN